MRRAGLRAAGSRAGTGRTAASRPRACATSGRRRVPLARRSSTKLRFAPLEHGVTLHPAAPDIGVLRNPGFLPEVCDELLRIGQALPDLRQEGRALAFLAVFENDAVHAGAEPRNQLGVAIERQPLGRRQERYFDVDVPELLGRERLEARVLER